MQSDTIFFFVVLVKDNTFPDESREQLLYKSDWFDYHEADVPGCLSQMPLLNLSWLLSLSVIGITTWWDS